MIVSERNDDLTGMDTEEFRRRMRAKASLLEGWAPDARSAIQHSTLNNPAPRKSWPKGFDAIGIAQAGFEQWAAKPHNKKWFRRIDGTPIPNDLPVCIAMAFIETLSPAPDLPAAAMREAGEVKPLKWKKSWNGKDWSTHSIVGRYDVGVIGAGYSAILRTVMADGQTEDVVIARGLGFDQAKASVEADLVQRIRSALAPAPPSKEGEGL